MDSFEMGPDTTPQGKTPHYAACHNCAFYSTEKSHQLGKGHCNWRHPPAVAALLVVVGLGEGEQQALVNQDHVCDCWRRR